MSSSQPSSSNAASLHPLSPRGTPLSDDDQGSGTLISPDLVRVCSLSKYCLICGCVDDLDDKAWYICHRHHVSVVDSEQDFLNRAALGVFLPYIQARRSECNKIFEWDTVEPGRIRVFSKTMPGGSMLNLSSYTEYQASRIRDCLVVNQECENSTDNEADNVRSMFLSAPTSPVKDVWEMHYNAVDPHEFSHYAFQILLKDGRRFYLDLTGKQFGPDWPLLMAAEDYRPRFVKSLIDLQLLGGYQPPLNPTLYTNLDVLLSTSLEHIPPPVPIASQHLHNARLQVIQLS
ncbi:hypothetical protein BDV96DRAFT_601385 [Lophiotrema nucula]|uniref:Uncharacterized protein n=1 Tax=Lophiotrema nucula TaxID=690887 RepID=A0A6A5Z183_9PLEO|nr:hypothetical protein BDV96DRAFT_601385 [Lophiotrema nucula]